VRAPGLVLIACLCVAPGAGAQSALPSVQIGVEQASGLAARLLLENRLAEARAMLDGLSRIAPDDPQVVFLRGQLAFAEGDFRRAVGLYRRLLSRDPNLVRVRLELARALFFAHDYEAARYHFRIALGQTLDRRARENIYGFLRAIEGRTSWFSLSAVVGPDSNPAFATDARSVALLGNVFVLDPGARARKSFGTVIDGRGRYAFGEDGRNFVASTFEWRDYAGSYADFQALQVTAGRSLVTGQSLWTVEVGPLGAWWQGRGLYSGALLRIANGTPLGERVLASAYLSAKRLEYQDYDYLTGNQVWAGGTLRYALDPTSSLWGSLSLGRNVARETPYSYRAAEMTFGYSKELPAHFNLEARLIASRYRYDAAAPLFGLERRDRMEGIEIDVTARDWSVAGFAPKLVLSASRNGSSVPLYDYRRRFVGVGVTREF